MAIRIDELEAQAEAGFSVSPGTQKAEALRVLVGNPEMAFKPREIATRTDIPAANAPTVCRRLVEMGVANDENGYYYLTQDEAIAAAARRALGSAHQQAMAQNTAAADESVFDDSGDAKPESMSDAEVDAELAAMDDELTDR